MIDKQEPTGIYDLPEKSEFMKALDKIVDDIAPNQKYKVYYAGTSEAEAFREFAKESPTGAKRDKSYRK